MKKLLLTTLIIGALAGSVFAQGLVSLSGKAYYNTVQGTTAGTAIPVATVAQVGTWGQMNVALVYSPTAAAGLFGATTAGSLTGDWVQALGIDSKITSPVAGTLALTTMTVGAATPEETFVVGWTGTYTTWNAAWAANNGANMLLAWSGENGVGSLGWSQVNATVPSPATGINTGVTGFNGIVLQPYQTVIIVPEPASFALLGLGAAALLIFRRRQ